jgi:hypothetical protein
LLYVLDLIGVAVLLVALRLPAIAFFWQLPTFAAPDG